MGRFLLRRLRSRLVGCVFKFFPFLFPHDFAILPPSCCYCCNSSRTGILQLTSCSLPPHGLLDPVNLNLSCLRSHVWNPACTRCEIAQPSCKATLNPKRYAAIANGLMLSAKGAVIEDAILQFSGFFLWWFGGVRGGEALLLQGNAEKSMMIMVGDVLKKTSAISGDAMWDVDDFVRAMYSSIILC